MTRSARTPFSITHLAYVALPVTLAVIMIAIAAARRLDHVFSVPDPSLLLSDFRETFPGKREENFRFLLLLGLWPTTMLVSAGLLARRYPLRETLPAAKGVLHATAALVAAFFLGEVAYQEFYVHVYLKYRLTLVLAIAFVLGPSLKVFPRPLWLDRSSKIARKFRPTARACGPIAFALSALHLVTCVFTDTNLRLTNQNIGYHIAFTQGDFAAIAAGHTALVDYFPMYSQLWPYVVAPFLRFFGVGTLSFTLAMAGLTAACMFCVFRVFRRLASDPGVTLLLYLAWLWMSFLPMQGGGTYRYQVFNYFAVGPLRLLGFWLVAALTLAHARDVGSRSGRVAFVAGVAALSAFNNVDFGFPAWIACLAVFAAGTLGKGRLEKLKTAAALLVGTIGAAMVVAAVPLVRTGHWPNWAQVLTFQNAFVRLGFSALPTPVGGLHWVILAALLSGLVYAATLFWNGTAGEGLSDRRDLADAFLFFGIAGSGAMAYYMNRSHWEVLIAMAGIGIVPFLLFAALAFRVPMGAGSQDSLLSRVGRAICALALASPLAFATLTPRPWDEVARFRLNDPSLRRERAERLAIIRARAQPGEAIYESGDYAQAIAFEAGAKNVFPFSNTLYLRSQLDAAEDAIQSHDVKWLFGEIPIELADWARAHGFGREEGVGTEIFQVWHR